MFGRFVNSLHPFLSLQATLRNYWSVFLLSLKTFFMCIWCQRFCKAVIGNNKPVLTSQCNLERSLFFYKAGVGVAVELHLAIRHSESLPVGHEHSVCVRARPGRQSCVLTCSLCIHSPELELSSPHSSSLVEGVCLFFFFKPEDAQINLLKVYGFKVISFENQKLSF